MSWDALLKDQPIEAKWLILDAYVARADVDHEWSSVVYAERIEWARSVARRLLREHGAAAAARIPQAMHLIRRLIGGAEADAAKAEAA